MPRWVKLSAIIIAALILLVLELKLTGIGGRHGPARHMPSAHSGGSVQAEQQRP